ncbi:MAG: S41 family peptidase [Dysgonamonadaceae bacterium]|jgi:hypothetical protein|nr:S41 family peptidase [Dysgonamonadaceae bacterium]
MPVKLNILSLFFLFILSSCIDIEEYPDNPRGNFEALWKIIDEHYCFFEYKNIDWDSVYEDYSKKITAGMNEYQLFNTLNLMLQELKDGHVNLVTSFDIGRYWKWFEDYPVNFYSELTDNYLGTDYSIAGGMRYKILSDNIGYIYYGNFSSGMTTSNLDYILARMAYCNGIIIDVRNNGGGLLSNVEMLAARFVEEKTLIGYISHKTGKGHNDFSEPYPRYIEPGGKVSCKLPVAVLTNRSCYSATNDFVNAMRYCPNVTVVGDMTGGGSGMPFGSELPNGWAVRFSSVPMFDANMQNIEFGIPPDIRVNLKDSDRQSGRDTIIETALEILKKLHSVGF